MIHKSIITALVAAAIASASCSSGSDGAESESALQAREQGMADAAALCVDSVKFTAHELHGAILAVRAREWEMRGKGDDTAADAYIDAFKTYLTENNHTLASEIF